MRNKNIDLSTVGGRIKAKRISEGYTQNELAELIMCKGNYISMYENNKVNIPLNTLRQIAQVLSTSVSYLVDGVEVEISEEEKELLAVFNKIGSAQMKCVAMEQMKCLLNI